MKKHSSSKSSPLRGVSEHEKCPLFLKEFTIKNPQIYKNHRFCPKSEKPKFSNKRPYARKNFCLPFFMAVFFTF